MKLQHILENQAELLLKLQTQLIDDLPDCINVDLIHSSRLGDVICIEIWFNGFPSKRFLTVNDQQFNTVKYTPNEFTSWSTLTYNLIVQQLTNTATRTY